MQTVCLHGTKFGVGVGGDVFVDHEFERSCREKKEQRQAISVWAYGSKYGYQYRLII